MKWHSVMDKTPKFGYLLVLVHDDRTYEVAQWTGVRFPYPYNRTIVQWAYLRNNLGKKIPV